MTNFKTNITNHLTDSYNFYLEELRKAKKQLDENPRAQWAKMEKLRLQTQVSLYNTILTNIKVGNYDFVKEIQKDLHNSK